MMKALQWTAIIFVALYATALSYRMDQVDRRINALMLMQK